MIHPVEQRTWELVESLLNRIDPGREGWTIDAGVGADDWWFPLLSDLKYRTVAIDPMMPLEADAVSQDHQTVLWRNAMLGGRTTKRMIYLSADPNLHSGVFGRVKETTGSEERSMVTLQYVIDTHKMERLTLLKLDIEGMETEVVESLTDCKILPDILVFEFGGFGPRRDGIGPWSRYNQSALEHALHTLHGLGYGPFWAITDVDDCPVLVSPRSWGSTIRPETGYGNIVTVREK